MSKMIRVHLYQSTVGTMAVQSDEEYRSMYGKPLADRMAYGCVLTIPSEVFAMWKSATATYYAAQEHMYSVLMEERQRDS